MPGLGLPSSLFSLLCAPTHVRHLPMRGLQGIYYSHLILIDGFVIGAKPFLEREVWYGPRKPCQVGRTHDPQAPRTEQSGIGLPALSSCVAFKPHNSWSQLLASCPPRSEK